MTDKELKKLSRLELIDIIYELQKRDKQNEILINELKDKLDDKEIRISKAGSIAEAVLSINGIWEATQEACDQYLKSIHSANGEMEAKLAKAEELRKEIIQDANDKATQIIRDAEDQRKSILEQTEKDVEKKWTAFREKAYSFINAYGELSYLIKKDR